MFDLNAFAENHWFLTWCALWLAWPIAWVLVAALGTLFKIVNRVLRSINVAIRGWPPDHLDGDGDWK